MSFLPSGASRPLPILSAFAIGLAVSGCGDQPRVTDPPVTPPITTVDVPPDASAPAINGPTTLAALVELARQRHPTAQAVAAARRAGEARIAQARTWANPELELTVGRTRPRVAEMESDRPYGLALSQRFEWWGKREARVAAVSAQLGIVAAESAVALLELDIDVRLAAIAFAVATSAAGQTAVQAKLAEELAAVVRQRQELGDINRSEAARIQLEATTARLRHDAAVRNVASTLAMLRSWCGETLPEQLVISDALVDPVVNALDLEIGGSFPRHPRLQAAVAAEYAAEAATQAERKARLPDVTVGVFSDREKEKDTLGFTLGIAVPLWDSNAGRIAEAEAERTRLASSRAVALQASARERGAAHAEVQATAAEVVALRDQAIPVAEEALRLRTSAFQGGDASLADVLDARRSALGVQFDLLDARRRHAEAQVRLRAAIGTGAVP